jgi:HSP20 family protein
MARTIQVENQNVDAARESRGESTRVRPTYSPNVDILENKDELLLLADMPGCELDDVDIQFEQGMLTVRGRVRDRRPDGARLLVQEYGIGDFHRSFRVSEAIDAAKIHAELEHGVLMVHLPKVEAVKPRQIQVKSR